MEARCPYFGTCGGCTSQHIPYGVQVENKQNILKRIIKDCVPVKVFSGEPFGYRNRMDFVFSLSGLGLRKRGDWREIIRVDSCPISEVGVNLLLHEVQMWYLNTKPDVFDIRTQTGTLRYCVIRYAHHTTQSSLGFVLNSDSSKIKETVEQIKEFAKKTSAQNIVIGYVPKDTDVSVTEDYFSVKGKDELSEAITGKTFSYNVQGFFQNNTAMAEKMVEYVTAALEKEDTKNATLIDLYGGVGVFGISLAERFKQVHVIENFAGSIESARKNAEMNGVNVNAVADDAANIHKLPFNRFEPLYVIADPPRSGMHPKAIERLMALQPKMIIYISCNPQQLEKELPKFLKYYSISDAAMFDLFPQTVHMESLIILRKN